MNKEWDSYIYWLFAIVAPSSEYEKLLLCLSQIDFEVIIPRDLNRVIDGVNLRQRYSEQRGEASTDWANNRECSVLELMAAMAIKCEEQITINPLIGNRTKYWFKVMLQSLGLAHMTNQNFDKNYVEHIIKIFMDHDYSPTGEGSLFVVKNPPNGDMRCVELWYQMMWYLDENFRE